MHICKVWLFLFCCTSNGDAPLNMLTLSQTFFLNSQKKNPTNARLFTSADSLGPFTSKNMDV